MSQQHSFVQKPNEDIERTASDTKEGIHQRKSRTDHVPLVASRPFVGRIGGNQEFTISPSDSSNRELIAKVPDAAATFSWKQSLRLDAFSDIDLWKEATIEGIGTCLQIYLAGLYAIGLVPVASESSIGAVTPAAFGAIANSFLISLFIFAGGPVSGKVVVGDGASSWF